MVRKTKQNILLYLCQISEVQRKQLRIKFYDISENRLYEYIRQMVSDGLIELFQKGGLNYVRITKAGVDLISKLADVSALRSKSASASTTEKKIRQQRIQKTKDICGAAHVYISGETFNFSNIINSPSETQKALFDTYFKQAGILFASDDIKAGIKKIGTYGEEVTATMSRYVGIILNKNGIWFVYHTLDKLMRWSVATEKILVNAVLNTLNVSKFLTGNPEYSSVLNKKPKSIVIGTGNSMLPKIFTGRKWGETESDSQIKRQAAERLLTYKNLSKQYSSNYFVPNTATGIEILNRTLLMDRQDLIRNSKDWFTSYASKINKSYSFVSIEGGLQASYDDDDSTYITLPVLNFENLISLRNEYQPITVIVDAGLQNSISRVLGSKFDKAVGFNFEPLKSQKYTDKGVLADGVSKIEIMNTKKAQKAAQA
ncbi:MAG: hypothetical protein RR415_06760 [Ruthenibacterium sp.]